MNSTSTVQTAPPLTRRQEANTRLPQEERFPLEGDIFTVHPCLREVYAKIGDLTALEEDWNDEGAPPIAPSSIRFAQQFVRGIVCTHAEEPALRNWEPAVFPTLEGGVELYWQTEVGQHALTFASESETIAVRQKLPGHPPFLGELAQADAIQWVLQTSA